MDMEEWVAYYKEHEALILFIAAWLLSIPTGIFISRLDTYLKNRSKTRKVKEILTHYAEVVMRRKELYYSGRSVDSLFPMSGYSVTFKVYILTSVIMLVQMFSSSAVANVYGEKASDLYFWITVFIVVILNTGAIAYGTKDDKVFHDAVYFNKYREKTITNLAQLGYGSGVLAKIDMDYGIE